MSPRKNVVVALLFAIGAQSVAPGANGESVDRMSSVQALRLEPLPGAMPTFYSPHTKDRAKYLQGLLGGEMSYYADLFNIPLNAITLAVLDHKQWPIVAGNAPYGMPSVDGTNPAVFVMPASWNGVTWMVIPKREEVPHSMLKAALINGRKWDQVKFEGCDGIGTHEIGHSIIQQLAIDTPTRWFNEFLASYIGYAYLKTKHPEQALSNEIFWTVGLQNSPHQFTTLDDFEEKYDQLQEEYPGNYGWYQLAIDQRVIEIYRQSGARYLEVIKREFPKGSAKLANHELLNKLEAITPGWRSWAAHLESGDLIAVLLPQSTR